MAITLDHMVLPAHYNKTSARFFADVMGLRYDRPNRHFLDPNGHLSEVMTYW
jgi:hypothetical protein